MFLQGGDDLSHSQLQVLFILTVYSFSIFSYKEYNQSDFSTDHLVMSMCKVISSIVEKEFAWTSAFFWQSSVSLCPSSFCTPRANLSVTSGISWLPNLHSNPLWWKWYLCFAVSSKRSRSSQDHSTSASSASVVGHRLELLWYWMACIGNEPRSLSFLRLYPTTSFRTLVDNEGYSISSMGLLLPVVDIMVIWIKFTHSCPF